MKQTKHQHSVKYSMCNASSSESTLRSEYERLVLSVYIGTACSSDHLLFVMPVSCVHAVVSDTSNVTMLSIHTDQPSPSLLVQHLFPPFVQKCVKKKKKKLSEQNACLRVYLLFWGCVTSLV